MAESDIQKTRKCIFGVAHRLDRPVSGVVVFTKTSKALARLNQLFKDKKVQKTYWAVVKKQPPKIEDTLSDYLVKNQAKNKSFTTREGAKGAKLGELSYLMLLQSERYYMLEIHPHTGRHHQIRVQLANIGCPIKGDLKYGFDRSNRDASIHLLARSIAFVHPVKKEPIKITAPPPDDTLWQVFYQQLTKSNL